MRKRLGQLRDDWSAYLAGRSIKQLSADEVYMLGHLAPSLQNANKIAFYRDFLTDSVQQGQADSIEGRKVLAQLRESCGVSEEEHIRIVDSLKGEYTLDDALLISANLRINSFKQALQQLIFTALEQGKSLSDAIAQHAEAIGKLREDFALSSQEEAQVIEELGSASGALATAIKHLCAQLRDIQQLQLHLTQLASEVFIFTYLQHQAQHIVTQCVELFAAVNAQDENLTELGCEFAASHPQAAEWALTQTQLELPQQLVNQLRTAIFVQDAQMAFRREIALLRLQKIDEPFVQLAVARTAQEYGYAWAEAAFKQSLETLMPATNHTHMLPLKPVAMVKLRSIDGLEKIWEQGFSAGRADDNDWVMTEQEASRHHFKIYQQQGVFYCEDLHSANGTILNGDFLQGQRQKLHDTNVISITHASAPLYIDVLQRAARREYPAVEGFFLFAQLALGHTLSHQLLWQLCSQAHWYTDQLPAPTAEVLAVVLKGQLQCVFSDTSGARENLLLDTGASIDLTQTPPLSTWVPSGGSFLCALWQKAQISQIIQLAPQFYVMLLEHSNTILQRLYQQARIHRH